MRILRTDRLGGILDYTHATGMGYLHQRRHVRHLSRTNAQT